MEFKLKSGKRIFISIKNVAWALLEDNDGSLKLYHPTHNNGGWPLCKSYNYDSLIKKLNSID